MSIAASADRHRRAAGRHAGVRSRSLRRRRWPSLLGVWLLNASFGWRMAALFVVGAGAGVVLYHAAFGFTSAWRVFIADGRGEGLRAQMLMLAVTCAVFFPLLAAGEAFGTRLNGSVQPVGVPVLAGAFIFGIGMQLGGGCASGTLFSVGGGNTRMVVTLLFFIVGSLIGTAHSAFWGSLPTFPATSLVRLYGPVAALAMSLVVFGAHLRRSRWWSSGASSAGWSRPTPASAAAAMAARAVAAGRRRDRPGRGEPRDPAPRRTAVGRHLGVRALGRQGGGGGRACRSRPGRTGRRPVSLPRWAAASSATSPRVMDFGIVLGALLAALLAGRFAPVWRSRHARWRPR